MALKYVCYEFVLFFVSLMLDTDGTQIRLHHTVENSGNSFVQSDVLKPFKADEANT